jgi:hypothetical protein
VGGADADYRGPDYVAYVLSFFVVPLLVGCTK